MPEHDAGEVGKPLPVSGLTRFDRRRFLQGAGLGAGGLAALAYPASGDPAAAASPARRKTKPTAPPTRYRPPPGYPR